jgi:tRNA-(ms[2]io[6]A)-hydroxylase
MIVRFSERVELVDAVSPVVAEEWGHFRKVLKELKKRGFELGKQRKDEYVLALQSFIKKGGSKEDHLLENLLICALIEARSCERFRLLSLHCSDESLREFYHEFMVSEAGHYRMFLDLARNYFPAERVKSRWSEWLEYEASVMQSLELRGDRVH